MNHEEVIQNLELQLSLLKKERAADYAQYQERMMNTSIRERVKNGVTWYPINIVSEFISTGDRITIQVKREKNRGQKHAFQVGAVACLFSEDEKKDKIVNGVVSYLKEDLMRMVLNDSYLPDWVSQNQLGINLLFDDATYREMNKALNCVIHAQNDRIAELRNIIYGMKKASFTKQYTYHLPTLNKIQNEAFSLISAALDVAFVHGPPGTGKTTTLVKCIKETVRQEKQVLVCAPSNAAVDLLVERLTQEEINVLRIGHPARLTHDVIENSLDVKVSKHPDFHRLKELRKKSEELKKLAGKYKRQFGKEERNQRSLLYKEAKALKNESKKLESYITVYLVDRAQVIATTLTGVSNSLISDHIFKTVFIDESSQALEAAAWISILRARRVIMSGDHHQLPPTIKSGEAAKGGLEQTLFAKGLHYQSQAVTMLEEQYRMDPAIMGFSSQQFYDGKLKAAQSIHNRKKIFDGCLIFIDTAGAGFQEKVKQETLSTYNEEEAVFLIKWIEQDDLTDLDVGIIAPYKAQIEVLDTLVNQSSKLAQFRSQININSVDAFQGQERDMIYISLVRSNSKGEIGFLKEYRRLNVAMTRAKHRLIMVGDSSTLGNDPFFNKMIDYVQQHGTYRSIYELHELLNLQ
ncbi:MAG: AAA domain-containing protein [Bacteroidota bacterium]